MVRQGLFACLIITICSGVAFGQGLFESIMGPSGLGVWSPGNTQGAPQLTNPMFYAPSLNPTNPQMNSYGYGSGQAGAGYAPQPQPQAAPGQQQYGTQYQAAPQQPGQGYAPPQQGAPAQAQQGAYAPPGPPAQTPAQAQGYSLSDPSGGVYPDWYNYQPVSPHQQGYQPGAYSQAQGGAPAPSGQRPTGQAENLPPGAMQVTTSGPDGTTIEYYPPAHGAAQAPRGQQQVRWQNQQAAPVQQQPSGQQYRQPRQQQRAQQGAQDNKRKREQTKADKRSKRSAGGVATPKPVRIPEGSDPRYGWGAGRN